RLVCQGSVLNSLDGLFENSNVYVTGDLDGGKKKKKKKVYTTKKKNKHIHKKIKLLPLTLYSIDSNIYLIQNKEELLSREKLAPIADLGPSWPSTGIDTTADYATLLSRWMQKQSRRTTRR
ncbi:UNVERIFIED_CONTAM: hypothetical protein GTU68_025423, partial [Idotea baltica]|nr:hypothetical protein [Idotea baltica]